MTKPTPGPWAQGITLMTALTRRWSGNQTAQNDREERRRVFANFTAADEGRGRVLVAVCEREEDARLVAAAPTLLEALQDAVEMIDNLNSAYGSEEIDKVARAGRYAIAKATGGAL